MKKKQQKQKTSDRKSRTSEQNYEREIELGDLGLEPPKIYREGQKSYLQSNARQARSGKNSELTRSQRRAMETKKRKKRNGLRKALTWICVVIFVAALGVVLSLTVFFRISDVTVSGNKIYSQEEILSRCTVDVGENLFMSDTKSAAETLEQSLPYIYKADIKRKLPDTVEITVTEAKVAYSVKSGDKIYIYLDSNFKVLEANAQKVKGIKISKADIKTADPGFEITFADDTTGDCLKKLAAVIKENDFTELTSIYSNSLTDNYVIYDGRIKFRLGSCDDLENKIFRGLAACEELNDSNPNVKGTMTITGGKSVYFTEKTE